MQNTIADNEISPWIVNIQGYEGPLDLLLGMARTQRLDLRRISILELAQQYLEFIETSRSLRIELAADFLVMAAWLAYLKSRLLLPPDPEDEGPTADELADRLAWRLERLAAMRDAAMKLTARGQLGEAFFARGEVEEHETVREVVYSASLHDMLRAYARVQTREDFQPLHFSRGPVMTLETALERLRGLIGDMVEWATLESYLPYDWCDDSEKRNSAVAANFAAVLQLVKDGDLELQQSVHFSPIAIRRLGEA